MAYERLTDVREKIKRVDKHIGDLKIAVMQFMSTNPYSIRVDTETEPSKPVIHVLKADTVPPDIRLIAGDAIQNLRSTLDYLACALVNSPNRSIEFPIFDEPIATPKLEARFTQKVKGMRKEVVDQIRDIHPYQGGDNLLWRLHRLNIVDKHNMLIAALGNITAINGLPPITDQWNGNRWIGLPGVPLALKEGDKFSVPGIEVGKDTQFFAEIVFNQPDIAEGYPVMLALRQFHRRVFSVVGELSWGLK